MKTQEHLGCGDSNCFFKKPDGMHTNGGCRCLDNLRQLGPYPRIFFRTANPQTIIALLDRYERAVEVIRFYAERRHWGNGAAEIDPCDQYKCELNVFRGGKRARDFLKSIEGEERG